MRAFFTLLLAAVCLSAEPARVDTSTAEGQALERMYNFDFRGAHVILDQQIRQHPQHALPYAVKAAALFFAELDRLKILQIDFFEDDDRVVDRKKLAPDLVLRAEFFRLIETSRERANGRLKSYPQDRDALFALCMSAGLVTDYSALVERRRLGSFPLAKQTQAYALKLLALNPPFYDAHMSVGSIEYVVGCLPFFFRWFVRIDQVEGSKEKALEHLELVAQRGRYYGPFARILLSVIHLREKRPQEAEHLLAGLAIEFPENPLIRRELMRVSGMSRRGIVVAGSQP